MIIKGKIIETDVARNFHHKVKIKKHKKNQKWMCEIINLKIKMNND